MDEPTLWYSLGHLDREDICVDTFDITDKKINNTFIENPEVSDLQTTRFVQNRRLLPNDLNQINELLKIRFIMIYRDDTKAPAVFVYRTILIPTIIYKHWPDTREFITRTVELWNRWIKLSCYYNSIYLVSIVYTCNTYVVMHWSM